MIPAHKQEDGYTSIPVGDHIDLTNWNWEPSPGKRVEVRRSGCDVRRGVIEAVMRDKSGFWLASDGVEPRVFVLLDDKEQTIRPAPVQREDTIPL